MGFSDIDRQFQRRAPAPIKLECLNCGGTDDSVKTRRPRWYNGFKDIPMCAVCADLATPVAEDLLRDRDCALEEYIRTGGCG